MSDGASFASFVDAHSRTLFGTAYLLTGTTPAAEDLVQETLAMLYPKWERVLAAQAPVAYVRRALTNVYLRGRRARGGHDIAMWDLPDATAAGDVAESVVNRDHLWQLLGSLSERQRAAIVLKYFHAMADADIASTLGCRVATVRSLISRGVADMREQSSPTVNGMRGGRS